MLAKEKLPEVQNNAENRYRICHIRCPLGSIIVFRRLLQDYSEYWLIESFGTLNNFRFANFLIFLPSLSSVKLMAIYTIYFFFFFDEWEFLCAAYCNFSRPIFVYGIADFFYLTCTANLMLFWSLTFNNCRSQWPRVLRRLMCCHILTSCNNSASLRCYFTDNTFYELKIISLDYALHYTEISKC